MKTEENRFKLSRTIHNKNGHQSTEKVHKATGISKSMIEDLESNVLEPRNTGYLTIAKLAQYYGVSIDYLAGLTDYPTPETNTRAICEHIGLSERSVDLLHYLNESDLPENKRTLSFLNTALSDPEIKEREDFPTTTVFSLLDQYIKSSDVVRKYENDPNVSVRFENDQDQKGKEDKDQESSEIKKLKRKTVPVESSEDLSEIISISKLYKLYKLDQIKTKLEDYCK